MISISDLGNCPRIAQPDSMAMGGCLDVWKDVTRLIIKDANGVDPFNTAAVLTAADLKAAIETKATHDAAILLDTTDKITYSPKIQNASKPKIMTEAVVLENNDRIVPGTFEKDVGTYMFYGATSEQHENMFLMMGNGREVMFVDAGGEIIYRSLSDEEVAAGVSPWFTTDFFNVSTRDIQTGGGNIDHFDVQISYPFTELVGYTKAETSAFGLII